MRERLVLATPEDMPHNIRPMLPVELPRPLDREGWLFQVKWDGFRGIAEINGSSVRLYSRQQKDFPNPRLNSVKPTLAHIEHRVVLDGEITILDEEGKPHFEWMQAHTPEQGRKEVVVFFIFDVLRVDGQNVRNLPLRDRNIILDEVLPHDLPNVVRVESFENNGIALFQAVQQQELEGIVGKDEMGAYEEGKTSKKWIKVKNYVRHGFHDRKVFRKIPQ